MYMMILAGLLALVSCSTSGIRRSVSNVGEAVPQQEAPLTFAQLVELAKSPKVESVADLLEVLSKDHPDFLRQRSLLHHSESLQHATWTEPRVLAYGRDAKLILTFNGSSPNIEVMRFEDSNKQFYFHEIQFKKETDKKSAHLLETEVEYESDRLVISKSNPIACMDCHGYVHTGPIWDDNHNWPGAYGSNDDLLFGSFDRDYVDNPHGKYGYLNQLKYPRSQGRALNLPEGTEDLELKGYLQYLAEAPKHPRYKYLPPQIFEHGFKMYAKGTPIELINETPVINAEESRLGIRQPDRPNLRLTGLLLGLSMESLKAEIMSIPGLEQKVAKALEINLISYEFKWGENRVEYFSNFESKIPEKGKSFQGHLNKILRDELKMEAQKVKRMETYLHQELIVPAEWTLVTQEVATINPQNTETEVVRDYARLLGRPLTRQERLGLEWEAGDLPKIAMIDSILQEGGVDFASYEINPKRALSLHSTGLEQLRELLH